ncbi:restriction endonuclease subunit S [Lysinibacillus sp. FSL K6-0057]|uniref:restriction endonuclease subunit S n=1 Tax=Lysinibacillus sp. FSL K6-0057 TaxID=2921411 RepID=UPI00315A67BC
MVKQFFLEEIAKIQIGHLIVNDQCFTREDTPFITEEMLMQLLREDDFSQVPKVDHTVDSFNLSIVPAKSILLNKFNLQETLIYQCKKAVCIGHDIIAIIPNESIVVSDYLFHFFKWFQINKERRNIFRLRITLPPLDIQHRAAQLLNAVQHLLMNKDSLVAAIEDLPQYFNNISNQVNQHSKNLHHSFEQLQHVYADMLHKVFNGDFLNDSFQRLSN